MAVIAIALGARRASCVCVILCQLEEQKVIAILSSPTIKSFRHLFTCFHGEASDICLHAFMHLHASQHQVK